jgi:hypothetical protein
MKSSKKFSGNCGQSGVWVVFMRGKPIGDFRDSWNKVVGEGGLSGMIFQDLRRTAVRTMVRAGVPEVVAMKISGHKTRSVFDRYNIVPQEDLRGQHKSRKKTSDCRNYGHKMGTICKIPQKKGLANLR